MSERAAASEPRERSEATKRRASERVGRFAGAKPSELVLTLILLAGLLIRIPGVWEPPLGFHATRQYHSLILARGYFLDRLEVGPAAREAARRAFEQQRGGLTMEPPVIEHAAALLYRVAGREDPTLARSIGVVSWIAGALAFWWLAAQLWPRRSAQLAGLAVFLFVPFGIPASQSFQPDAPAWTLTFAAAGCLIFDDARRRPSSYALSAAAGAAAILAKLFPVFLLLPLVFALRVRRNGWRRGPLAAAAWAAVAALPAAVWYGTFAASQAEGRVFPELLWSPAFWLGWLHMIDAVVWLPLFIVAAAGAVIARGRARLVLLALWGGYVAMGLVFTYHIHTHNYYSLPLIPIVALSIAALVDVVDVRLTAPRTRTVAGWAGAGLLVLGLGASIRAAGVLRPSTELRTQAADYTRIGQIVGPGANVITLDGNYGFPLNYHGYQMVSNWPLSGDRAAARLAGRELPSGVEQLATASADFFVATMQSELDAEPDLHRLLEERYPLVERGGPADHWRYLVFDLRHPKFSVTPEKVSVFALTDASLASESHVALWTPAGMSWRAARVDDPVAVQPDHGVGPATLALTARPTPAELDRTFELPIYAAGSATPSARLTIRFRSLSARPKSLPMGSLDSPGDPVFFTGAAVTFQGWALDALDLRRVRVEATDEAGRVKALGETRGTWMRPDVARAFPDAHDIFNCGWSFVLEPKMLSDVTLPATLRFYGESGDGRRGEIGRRTVRRN